MSDNTYISSRWKLIFYSSRPPTCFPMFVSTSSFLTSLRLRPHLADDLYSPRRTNSCHYRATRERCHCGSGWPLPSLSWCCRTRLLAARQWQPRPILVITLWQPRFCNAHLQELFHRCYVQDRNICWARSYGSSELDGHRCLRPDWPRVDFGLLYCRWWVEDLLPQSRQVSNQLLLSMISLLNDTCLI